MFDLNSIQVIGRLTYDPELREGQSGKPYLRFTVANNIRGFDGERSTNYFKAVSFGKVAQNMANYLHKGSLICVTGIMQENVFENEEGETKRSWSILVDHVQFLSEAKGNGKHENHTVIEEEDAEVIQF